MKSSIGPGGKVWGLVGKQTINLTKAALCVHSAKGIFFVHRIPWPPL